MPKEISGCSEVARTRVESVSWVDANGDFWIFGGSGFSSNGAQTGVMDDLWEYFPVHQRVDLGERDKQCMLRSALRIDASGDLWLFGGANAVSPGFYLNTLWKFTP